MDPLRRGHLTEEVVQKERQRYSRWYYEPQSQRICSKNYKPHLGSLLHARKELDSVFKHDQKLNFGHFSHTLSEESKWRCEKQISQELPLLLWRGETHKQPINTGTFPKSRLLWRFAGGSLVELEGGRLKHVEDLRTEDLEQCARLHPELMMKRFSVLKITASGTSWFSWLQVEIEQDCLQLCLEVSEGLPFFVSGHGWSSCNPLQTSQSCNLQCRQLKVGDLCLALARVPATSSKAPSQKLTG
ncbi:hypothetical protein DNTS_031432, partial [Danionella cerebrum]